MLGLSATTLTPASEQASMTSTTASVVIVATCLHVRGRRKGQVTQQRVSFTTLAEAAAWFGGLCELGGGPLPYQVKEAEIEGLGRVTFDPWLELPAFQAFVPDGCDDCPVWCKTAMEAWEHLAGKEEDRARAFRRRMYAYIA
jgi:hypothetical protein